MAGRRTAGDGAPQPSVPEDPTAALRLELDQLREVNARLKKMLVASVGEDVGGMSTRGKGHSVDGGRSLVLILRLV